MYIYIHIHTCPSHIPWYVIMSIVSANRWCFQRDIPCVLVAEGTGRSRCRQEDGTSVAQRAPQCSWFQCRAGQGWAPQGFLLSWRHCLRNSTIPSDIYHKVIARLRGQGFQAHVVTALPRLCRPLPFQREHEVFTHRIWVLDFKKNISNDSYLRHMPFNGGERACTSAPLICSQASGIRVIRPLVFLEYIYIYMHIMW